MHAAGGRRATREILQELEQKLGDESESDDEANPLTVQRQRLPRGAAATLDGTLRGRANRRGKPRGRRRSLVVEQDEYREDARDMLAEASGQFESESGGESGASSSVSGSAGWPAQPHSLFASRSMRRVLLPPLVPENRRTRIAPQGNV